MYIIKKILEHINKPLISLDSYTQKQAFTNIFGKIKKLISALQYKNRNKSNKLNKFL